MKRKITATLFAAIFFSACTTLPSPTKQVNIIDSLEIKEGLGNVVEQIYSGVHNDTTFTLTLLYQEHSGDGVYSLDKKWNTTNELVYGKRYTLRGDATNIDATVYELKPYDKSLQSIYFRHNNDNVKRLDKNLKDYNLKLHLKERSL